MSGQHARPKTKQVASGEPFPQTQPYTLSALPAQGRAGCGGNPFNEIQWVTPGGRLAYGQK